MTRKHIIPCFVCDPCHASTVQRGHAGPVVVFVIG